MKTSSHSIFCASVCVSVSVCVSACLGSPAKTFIVPCPSIVVQNIYGDRHLQQELAQIEQERQRELALASSRSSGGATLARGRQAPQRESRQQQVQGAHALLADLEGFGLQLRQGIDSVSRQRRPVT